MISQQALSNLRLVSGPWKTLLKIDPGSIPLGSSFTLNVVATDAWITRTTQLNPSLIGFFVLPESPIGAILIVVSSMGVLGAYLYIRARMAPARS